MKVLFVSPAFLPRLGGLETVVDLVAGGLAESGLDVVVLTTTAGPGPSRTYRVQRRATAAAMLRVHRWADVVVHANVSLRLLWPLVAVPRPLVAWHHSWYSRDGVITVPDRLKRSVTRRASASIAPSRVVADDLGAGTRVMPNPYRDDIFPPRAAPVRDRELVAVGRLVSDKGFDTLIAALANLGSPRPTLTIAGEGPEREPLERQAAALGIADRVRFLGALQPVEVSEELARHRILVAPSRYHEPFGLVALEGLACGCVPVVSAEGGLVQAAGGFGFSFPNGDAGALAAALGHALGTPRPDAAAVAAHLAPHRPRQVAGEWVRLLDDVVARGRAEVPSACS